MGEPLLQLASASGRVSLAVRASADGGLSLTLTRAGDAAATAYAALRGVRAGGEWAAGGALALAGGGELAVEPHAVRDQFAVRVRAGDGARTVEAAFELDGVGECYGLGHLMRQPWPLQDGALELGPFYVSRAATRARGPRADGGYATDDSSLGLETVL